MREYIFTDIICICKFILNISIATLIVLTMLVVKWSEMKNKYIYKKKKRM